MFVESKFIESYLKVLGEDFDTSESLNSHGRRISTNKKSLENFFNWFGDSKAKDSKGRPLVFFHGTLSDFTEFKTQIKSTNQYGIFGGADVTRHAIFVTPDIDFASTYASADREGANIISVYIRAEKPFDLRFGLTETQESELNSVGFNTSMFRYIDNFWELFDDDTGEHFVKSLKSLGYDSAIIKEHNELNNATVDVWVLFSSNQLKSVYGNIGTYSKDSPSIIEKAKL